MSEAAIAIKKKVDELAKWTKLASECKNEIEKLKGEFEKLGEDAMQDKKIKQVEFWGNNSSKVVVTESEKIKVLFPTLLAGTLGDVFEDYAKEKKTYEYTDPFKQILVAIFQGSYVDHTLDDVIRQIPTDDGVKKVLKKKLKGKWDKDASALINLAKLSKEDAEFYAFQVQEAIIWERIVGLLKAAGHTPGTESFDKALDEIKSAIIVEDGLKVGVEMEDLKEAG